MSRTPSAWLSSVPTILRCWHWSRRGSGRLVLAHSAHGGADVVLEVAGSEDTFRLAWQCARPNAVVTVVALYDRPQLLPSARHVRQESHLQDRRGGWLQLCRDPGPDRRREAGHHSPHHPHLSLSRTSTRPTSSSSPGGRASSRWPSSPDASPAILRQIAPQGAGGTLWIP